MGKNSCILAAAYARVPHSPLRNIISNRSGFPGNYNITHRTRPTLSTAESMYDDSEVLHTINGPVGMENRRVYRSALCCVQYGETRKGKRRG